MEPAGHHLERRIPAEAQEVELRRGGSHRLEVEEEEHLPVREPVSGVEEVVRPREGAQAFEHSLERTRSPPRPAISEKARLALYCRL